MSVRAGSFDPAVLAPDPRRRSMVLAVLAAALAAVEPETAVRNALRRSGENLVLGEATVSATSLGRAFVLAFGKAAPAMARGAVAALDGIPRAGVVVAPEPGADPSGLEPIPAGHPYPDAGSVAAATRVLELAGRAGSGDLAIVLISGGGSALLERPAGDLSLADLDATNRLLLAAGAEIGEINTVRKHLSAVKGGRLAQALAPARVVTLVLSDVVGSPPDVIASGPTVPDPTTFADALAVLARHGLDAAAPPAVLEHLRRGAAGLEPETPARPVPGSHNEIVVVGDGRVAAAAAAAEAQRRGVQARVAAAGLTGDAEEAAAAVVAAARRGAVGEMAIYAGETTVAVRGDGRGGRNQQLALAAALGIADDPSLVVASLATDGVDGPTDGAGGLVDGGSVGRGRYAGMEAADHLARNDAYPFLAATHDLLVTGPTGTNVADLVLSWRT